MSLENTANGERRSIVSGTEAGLALRERVDATAPGDCPRSARWPCCARVSSSGPGPGAFPTTEPRGPTRLPETSAVCLPPSCQASSPWKVLEFLYRRCVGQQSGGRRGQGYLSELSSFDFSCRGCKLPPLPQLHLPTWSSLQPPGNHSSSYPLHSSGFSGMSYS